jgi:hypothetical protein
LERVLRDKEDLMATMTKKMEEMKSDNAFLLREIDRMEELAFFSKSTGNLRDSDILCSRSRWVRDETRESKDPEMRNSLVSDQSSHLKADGLSEIKLLDGKHQLMSDKQREDYNFHKINAITQNL